MSDIKQKTIDFILAEEGGLVWHKDDPGGVTNFGVSLRYLKQLYKDSPELADVDGDGDADADDIRSMTKERAEDILVREYWEPLDWMPDDYIRLVVCDMAYNAGMDRAIKMLQGVCGAVEDGIVGVKTKSAVFTMWYGVYEGGIVEKYTLARIKYYTDLAAKSQFRPFLRGWILRAIRAAEVEV